MSAEAQKERPPMCHKHPYLYVDTCEACLVEFKAKWGTIPSWWHATAVPESAPKEGNRNV